MRVNLLGRPCVDRGMTSRLLFVNGARSRPARASDLHRVGRSWTQSDSGAQTLAFDGEAECILTRDALAARVDTYPLLIVVPGGPQMRNEGCWLEVHFHQEGCGRCHFAPGSRHPVREGER
jgi:hypothetical protein